MMRLLTLIRVEWIKTFRLRSTYVSFAVVGLHALIVQFGVYFWADDAEMFEFLSEAGMDTSLVVNGFIGTRLAMEVGFVLLIAPMMIMTFARQIAGEDLRGTLRLLLSRPISRLSVVIAKFTVCIGWSLTLMAFFLGLSYGVGLILFGAQPSITVGRPWEMEQQGRDAARESQFGANRPDWDQLSEEERDQRRRQDRIIFRNVQAQVRQQIATFVIDPAQCIQRLFIACLLGTWALVTVGSIAFFFSTINKHPIAAMSMTIGTYFMVVIIQGLASAQNIIPLFQKVEPYLFTKAMDFWRGCFSIEIDWTDVWKNAALLGAYSAFFFTLSAIIFSRKDITS